MGLGSILGTGVFISIGIAAGIADERLLLAVFLAGVIATFNGLSSAQLAANHPVSGGTYAYGRRYLGEWYGFAAGWMFVCAKSASAATALLGLAGYFIYLIGVDIGTHQRWLALSLTLALTLLVAGGLRRSNLANALIVSVTLLALLGFVLAGWSHTIAQGPAPLAFGWPQSTSDWSDTLEATALMFVAYTGYGRVATLGEEIREPARNIPRAIIATLAVSLVTYLAVATTAVALVGPKALAETTRTTSAPLEVISAHMGIPGLSTLVAIGALTAMTGVVLNLLLGISRVILAMARTGDLPAALSRVRSSDSSPARAVWCTGTIMAILVSIGSIELAWTFSAFTVLVYYGITNLAALRLGPQERRFPRWVPALGCASCFGAACFIELDIWAVGVALLMLGLVGRMATAKRRSS